MIYVNMIYVNQILHWEIAKIVILNDLMQWNIVVRITNSIGKTVGCLVAKWIMGKKHLHLTE